MTTWHRLAACLLLGLALLTAALRLLPRAPPRPLPACRHPLALREGGRVRVLCLERASVSAEEVRALLGRRECGAARLAGAERLRAGQLLALEGCRLQPAPLPGTLRLLLGLRLDLNLADQADLEALPRIGPVLARRILEARRARAFGSVDELRRVKGIGPVMLARLRPLTCAADGCQ